MYFVTDIKLVDMKTNSYRHLDSYNNRAKLRGDLLLSLYDDKSDTMTSMTVAYRELNYFFRNAFKRYKILLPSKDFISITKHIALLPLLDYIDDYLGVVTAEDYYVTIPKRVFNLISYIDYEGTWNERDLDRNIVSQFPTDKLIIDFLADDYGLFVGICDGFVVQRKYMSIMEAIFKVSCVRYENKLYFKGNQGVVYEYVIEDVPKFDILYTKLNALGVVCQSMHYYMQLNNLFDIILSGELDLQDVSSMYSRIDDRITVIYSGYMHKGYRYKYEYKVTDLDKFQLLLTKISIRYSKFF